MQHGIQGKQCLCPPGRPRSSFNNVTLRDCQHCCISRPYRDAQDRLLRRDKTYPARTWLIMNRKAFDIITITVIIAFIIFIFIIIIILLLIL